MRIQQEKLLLRDRDPASYEGPAPLQGPPSQPLQLWHLSFPMDVYGDIPKVFANYLRMLRDDVHRIWLNDESIHFFVLRNFAMPRNVRLLFSTPHHISELEDHKLNEVYAKFRAAIAQPILCIILCHIEIWHIEYNSLTYLLSQEDSALAIIRHKAPKSQSARRQQFLSSSTYLKDFVASGRVVEARTQAVVEYSMDPSAAHSKTYLDNHTNEWCQILAVKQKHLIGENWLQPYDFDIFRPLVNSKQTSKPTISILARWTWPDIEDVRQMYYISARQSILAAREKSRQDLEKAMLEKLWPPSRRQMMLLQNLFMPHPSTHL